METRRAGAYTPTLRPVGPVFGGGSTAPRAPVPRAAQDDPASGGGGVGEVERGDAGVATSPPRRSQGHRATGAASARRGVQHVEEHGS